jgi:hypothetical protein
MTYDEIRAIPTSLSLERVCEMAENRERCAGWHESVLTRAYHTLQKTISLLEEGTPPSVVLELIRMMQGGKSSA